MLQESLSLWIVLHRSATDNLLVVPLVNLCALYLLQQLRKLVLEIIHRMPANDNLRTYVKVYTICCHDPLSVMLCVYDVVQAILSTMFLLLETENEENVLVCLRVIIELHKQFRPQYSPDVSSTLLYTEILSMCM